MTIQSDFTTRNDSNFLPSAFEISAFIIPIKTERFSSMITQENIKYVILIVNSCAQQE